jgi:hypothetical protein
LTPQECIDLAYGGVLREKSVICGIVMQHEEANGRF